MATSPSVITRQHNHGVAILLDVWGRRRAGRRNGDRNDGIDELWVGWFLLCFVFFGVVGGGERESKASARCKRCLSLFTQTYVQVKFRYGGIQLSVNSRPCSESEREHGVIPMCCVLTAMLVP